MREGSCFGETNFALNSTAGHYAAFANTKSIVLEISQFGQLERTLREDAALAARFYCIVAQVVQLLTLAGHKTLKLARCPASQVIEKDLRETLEETFPGTWSRKTQFARRLDDGEEDGRMARKHSEHKKKRGSFLSRTWQSRHSLQNDSVSAPIAGSPSTHSVRGVT